MEPRSTSTAEVEPLGFVVRCMRFFGKKDGQSTKEFGAEVKALSNKDRAEFIEMFNAAGMPTVDSRAPTA